MTRKRWCCSSETAHLMLEAGDCGEIRIGGAIMKLVLSQDAGSESELGQPDTWFFALNTGCWSHTIAV